MCIFPLVVLIFYPQCRGYLHKCFDIRHTAEGLKTTGTLHIYSPQMQRRYKPLCVHYVFVAEVKKKTS